MCSRRKLKSDLASIHDYKFGSFRHHTCVPASAICLPFSLLTACHVCPANIMELPRHCLNQHQNVDSSCHTWSTSPTPKPPSQVLNYGHPLAPSPIPQQSWHISRAALAALAVHTLGRVKLKHGWRTEDVGGQQNGGCGLWEGNENSSNNLPISLSLV